MNKCVSILLTLTFFCVSISSVQGIQTGQNQITPLNTDLSGSSSNNTMIYVDDDNTEGPWIGTEEYPYKEIQDGIDAANNGDTVFVFKGEYGYFRIMDKSISVIGEDRESTIVNSHVFISSSGIYLSNFTFQKSQDAGIKIKEGNLNIIQNNIIKLNNGGISLSDSNNNKIENNIIKNSSKNGITISWSYNNIIKNNKILNSKGGVGINLNYVRDTLIQSNNIKNNKYGIKIWNELPRIPFTEKTKIRNNNFLNNTYSAGIKSEVSILYTKFSHNYWDRGRILPKMIYKFDYPYPLPLNIDWRPALTQNEIIKGD